MKQQDETFDDLQLNFVPCIKILADILHVNSINEVLKFGINWLATGKLTQRHGNMVNECILCGSEEDNLHLLLCPHRLQVMQEAMNQFHTYLKEINTEPQLITTLMIHIHSSLVLIPDADFFMPTKT